MDYLEKHIGLTDGDFLSEGEQRMVPLADCHGRLEVDDRFSRGHVKTAASNEAIEAASKVKPHPDRVYVMVIGLGSSEFWGVNNNGDSFPEAALLGRPPSDRPMSFFDKYAHRIKGKWGHETFRQAHAFQEHMNSNPSLAIGGIHDTFWNSRMHRVENIVYLDRKNARGKKWVDRIDNGIPVGTSMACRIPFDRCSLCQNIAPTRPQYCKHIKMGTPDYSLRQIKPDGKAVSMINDFPTFFDESFVETPAAPEALMIMKVARDESKIAAQKQAEIKKEGPDLPLDVSMDDLQGLYEAERQLPPAVLSKLSAMGLVNAIKAASGLGICLRPSEVYSVHLGLDSLAGDDLSRLDKAALYVAPDSIKTATIGLNKLGSPDHIKVAKCVDILRPFASTRSYQEPYVTTRLMSKIATITGHRVSPSLSGDVIPLLGIYHTLYKEACGEFGYGQSQLQGVAMSRFGTY